MITQQAWMFLSSFEKLRVKLSNWDLITMAHLGPRAFEEIGGEVVQTTTFVIRNSHLNRYKGVYSRLLQANTQFAKEQLYLEKTTLYVAGNEIYSKIPGKPIAYWVSQQFANLFDLQTIKDVAKACIGMRTGDNERFLRVWFEVADSKIGYHCKNHIEAEKARYKWIPYNKGGEFRKWYGNHDYVVNWENNGFEIKENTRRVYPQLGDNLGWKISNEQYYFQEGISWTVVTSKVCFRRYYEGCIFSNSGQSVISSDSDRLDYLTGLLNSVIAEDVLNMISPTLGFESGYVNKIPVVIRDQETVKALVEENIEISMDDWNSFETSWDFKRHPLV
jgi:hypothetical protein